MSTEGKKMGLALVCSDGRLHQEAAHYNQNLAEALGVDLVDIVAIPGPDGLQKPGREAEAAATLGWLKLLADAHHPIAFAVCGHYTCAGNPAENSVHDSDSQAALEYFKEKLNFTGTCLALSATHEADEHWPLKEVARI